VPTKIVHNQPARVTVEYGSGPSGSTVALVVLLVVAMAAAGGAARAGHLLDGVLRFALIVTACVAVAGLLILAHLLRRVFWNYHRQREQEALAAQTQAREIAVQTRTAISQQAAAADVPAIAPRFDADTAYVLSGDAVQTVRVERFPKEEDTP